MKQLILAGLVCLPLVSAQAADEKHTELGAHQHGHGSFNMVIDGKNVLAELDVPGADIVGFEHKARTKKQKAAVTAAKKALSETATVFVVPAAAGCKAKKGDVKLIVEDGDHDHGHSHGKKHSHDKKEKGADAKEASHSEFKVTYSMTYSDPAKLTDVTFPYFEKFKGAEELDVKIVGPKSQRQFEVTRDAAQINLGGIM